jgi:hypothetical protein
VPAQVLVDTGYENAPQIQTVEAAHPAMGLCPPARSGNASLATRFKRLWRATQQCITGADASAAVDPSGLDLAWPAENYGGTSHWHHQSRLGLPQLQTVWLAKVRTEGILVSLALNCRRLALRWH